MEEREFLVENIIKCKMEYLMANYRRPRNIIDGDQSSEEFKEYLKKYLGVENIKDVRSFVRGMITLDFFKDSEELAKYILHDKSVDNSAWYPISCAGNIVGFICYTDYGLVTTYRTNTAIGPIMSRLTENV